MITFGLPGSESTNPPCNVNDPFQDWCNILLVLPRSFLPQCEALTVVEPVSPTCPTTAILCHKNPGGVSNYHSKSMKKIIHTSGRDNYRSVLT